ncbi:hypothetical protein [Roseateles sp.]|uniref:hypothetical protein n=1 Tax=Roseateles sp. TaxID=1971397 RepID=UPI0025FCCE62|nr:hypothetical protein [Roseateles sp.]MBV8033807.1 hypothetical protein [Roseateles sp.]
MSDTIQTRHYTARQAALLQRPPSDIIEAADSIVDVLGTRDQFTVQLNYSSTRVYGAHVNIIGAGAAGRGPAAALTAGTKVVVLSTSWPTTAPELLVDLDDYQAENSWSRWSGEAKKALQNAASTAPRQTTAAARWRVERLSSLQAAFGFTIQDLAAVLDITRPQLYKWLDATNDIKLQEASRARLATVEHMAKEWTSRSTVPLSSVSKEPLTAGGTAFALLSADVINDATVIGAFDELVGKLHGQPKSRSQRLRDAGFTRRPSVRALPSDE